MYEIDHSGNCRQYYYTGKTLCRIAFASGQYLDFTWEGNHVKSIQDCIERKISYRYENGLLTEAVMVTGGIERYRYDSDGRVTDIIDANGVAYVHNEYDRKGRVTRQTLYDGQEYVMLYNDDDRTNTYLTPASGREVRYTYDRSHQLVCTGYQDGTTQERAYDIWENIVWEKDRNGNVTRHTYDEYGHLLEEERSDGLVISYVYDTAGNCCHMWDNGGTEIHYRYDNKGNLIEETEQIDDNQTRSVRYNGNGDRLEKYQKYGTTKYSYDNMRRLAKVGYPNATEELFYDKAGNRTKRLYNGTEELYQYDKRNRLTAYTKGGVTSQYEYDNAGNLLKDDKARYVYDAFNRNTKVETFNGNIQINHYDAEGPRHEMEENGKLVSFIYRGDEVIAEESQEDRIRYIRTSVLLASDAESARTYYHYASDEMSSITHVVDENEEILNHYEYDVWGNLTACEEKVQNRFKFNGQQYDPISQQYYLRARYYNPVIGRFTQEDSYNVDGLNLYVYCRNNPVSYVDPSGNICGRRANTLMDNVLSGKPLTRKERRQLSARLRDEARNGTISDKGRNVARQMGIDIEGIEAGIKNQAQSRQNATEDNRNESDNNFVRPDSSQFPQTRLAVHNDLISKGYHSTGTTDIGYVVYKDGKGRTVNIKPDGEVIPVVKVPEDPNNTSPKAPKRSQRTYYDGTFIPDEINDHTTGHNVGRISVDDFYPEPYKWVGIATWMKENSK